MPEKPKDKDKDKGTTIQGPYSGDAPISDCPKCGGHGSYQGTNPCPECGAI